MQRWIGFSEKCQSGSDRWDKIAAGANIRRQSRTHRHRVEDNAIILLAFAVGECESVLPFRKGED
jgi:hypothetical protein